MNKTQIEWVKNPDFTGIPERDTKGRFQSQGYTWNPITGCLNHVNGMCKGGGFPCYAYKLANGRLKQRYLANENIAPIDNSFLAYPAALNDPFYPRFWPERLDDITRMPLPWHKKFKFTTKGIFVCDMGELFGDWIPEEWQEKIFGVIRACSHHRFYLLTKQPQNLIKFSPFPDNCWVGFTATSTDMFAQSIIKSQGIRAKVRYVSFEPLLEWSWNKTYREPLETVLEAEGINQVIIGAQTKPYLPPEISCVEEIVRAADQAGIPVFLKNNLYPLLSLGNGKSICHNNEVGTLRQEMPA